MAQRISIIASRPLRTVVTAMKALPTENRREIRTQSRLVIVPEWRKAVYNAAASDLERRVIAANARAAVSDRNVTLRAGGSRRALSGGLIPAVHNRAVEFGGGRDRLRTYATHSRRGKAYQVTRHTQRQLPPFRRQGYVFYQAVAEMTPRIAALWAQTWARGIYEAMRGTRG